MSAAPPPPPAWIAQPSPADLARAEGLYAPLVQGGHAVMNCYVRADGWLEACEADAQTTAAGLATATVSLQDRYRLDVTRGPVPTRLAVTLDFHRMVDVAPRLMAEPSKAEAAAAAGVAPGLAGEVEVACAVTPMGAPEGCEPSARSPHDARLDVAAKALAAGYRFKPATLAGKPVAAFTLTTVRVGAIHAAQRVDFLRRPTPDEMSKAYPLLAVGSRREGRAVIHCRVDSAGRLDDCTTVEEAPRGLGFGDAALQLSTKFRVRLRTADGEPTTDGDLTMPVNFKIDPASNSAPAGYDIKVMAWAPWIHSPSAADVAAAFPKGEAARGVYDLASMLCAFRRDGRLKDCEATTPLPRAAFDAAALSLAPGFQIDTTGVTAKQLAPLRVAITVAFSARALEPAAERHLRAPDWVSTPDGGAIVAAYPEAASKAGVLSGIAIVECRVGAAGRLESCATASETPTDLGFGQAALRVAPLMRANLWTRDGEAAVDQKVRVPLHFVLTAGSTPPAATAH